MTAVVDAPPARRLVEIGDIRCTDARVHEIKVLTDPKEGEDGLLIQFTLGVIYYGAGYELSGYQEIACEVPHGATNLEVVYSEKMDRYILIYLDEYGIPNEPEMRIADQLFEFPDITEHHIELPSWVKKITIVDRTLEDNKWTITLLIEFKDANRKARKETVAFPNIDVLASYFRLKYVPNGTEGPGRWKLDTLGHVRIP